MEKLFTDKFEYEHKYLEKGFRYIAGIDEVGRGPLAGPVVCCAVIMPLDDLIEGIDDSKKLSEIKRDKLSPLILEKAIDYKICRIEPDEIDEINILEATKKCMKMCVEGLRIRPDVVLVDAIKLDIKIPTEGIIQGDAKSYSIGAASIAAKVFRDKLMVDYSKIYPEYGFEQHKGYGTRQHIEALEEYGACKIHRKTFIKNFSVKTEKI